MHTSVQAHMQKHTHTYMKRGEMASHLHTRSVSVGTYFLCSQGSPHRYSLTRGSWALVMLPTYSSSSPWRGQDQWALCPACTYVLQKGSQKPISLVSAIFLNLCLCTPGSLLPCTVVKEHCALLLEPVLLKSWTQLMDMESYLMIAVLCRRTWAQSETGLGSLSLVRGQEQ